MNQLTASMENEVSQYRERISQTARAAVARRLRAIVEAHEEKHGPTLPGRDLSRAWVHSLSPEQEALQMLREVLIGINALREELEGGHA